jgi:hypothetical protein
MRRVFNLVAAASLVLCAATAALWVRSYWHVDLLGAHGRETPGHWQRAGHVSSANGSLNVNWSLRDNGPASARSTSVDWAYETWPVRSVVPAAWHGFGYEAVNFDTSPVASDGRAMPVRMTYTHRVTMPHWFVVLLGTPPIGMWVRRATRQPHAPPVVGPRHPPQRVGRARMAGVVVEPLPKAQRPVHEQLERLCEVAVVLLIGHGAARRRVIPHR